MAKPATEAKPRRESSEAKGFSKESGTGPLAQARSALARGDVRAARKLLRPLEQGGAESERAEALALEAGLGLDRAALATALAVLAVIALAAIFALFTRHG